MCDTTLVEVPASTQADARDELIYLPVPHRGGISRPGQDDNLAPGNVTAA